LVLTNDEQPLVLTDEIRDKKDIKYVAHPGGSYNKDTLKIIRDLGIEIGFVNSMDISKEKNMKKINNSFQ